MAIPVGHAQVTLHHRTPAGPGFRDSVVTFGVVGIPSAESALQIGTAWVQTVWTQLGSAQMTFTGVTMRDSLFVWESDFSVVGNTSDEPADPQVSLLVRKLTGFAGKKNRGRMYPPGQSYGGTFNSGGAMSPGNLITYQEKYDDFLGELTASDNPMVLFHGEGLGGPTTVTSLVVDGLVATQRRRTGR